MLSNKKNPEQSIKYIDIYICQLDLISFSSLSWLEITGFRWDRQWIVVNNKGRAYTQRVEPKLALVEVQLPNEAFSEDWEPTKSSYMGKFFVCPFMNFLLHCLLAKLF